VNVMVAHDVLGGASHLPEGICVEAHVDAQATAHVLIRGKATSKMMQLVHQMALQSPQFVDMLPVLLVKHCFGLGNVASGAVSRGYNQVLRAIARALDVRLIKVATPDMALWMLDTCVSASKLKHDFRWGAHGIKFGEADHPGPFFTPTQSDVEPQPQIHRERMSDPPLKRKRSFFEPMQTQPALSISNVVPQEHKRADHMLAPVHSVQTGPLDPQQLATMLWHDGSEHDICRGDWEQLMACCEMAIPVAADAFAQRTAEADVRNWKIWSDYCAVMKTNPHRPPIDLAHDRPAFLREVVLLINALMHFMRTRKPRSAADVMIKPQSTMTILLGANRVLRANFSSFIPLSHLKLPL